MKYTVLAALLGVAHVNAADASWNYLQQGADWEDACTLNAKRQSPINLDTRENVYPVVQGVEKDEISYLNQNQRTVDWNGHTSQVNLQTDLREGEVNGFMTSIPMEVFGAAKSRLQFDAQQFHFHSPSEHAFDGNLVDLEMHTVHYPSSNEGHEILASAVGIMFSVNNYNVKLSDAERFVIDNFFQSLKWHDTDSNPDVDLIAYGHLLHTVDFENRFVYSGSVTTPPCAQPVYWNVISKVYPVSQETVDMFKAQLSRPGGVNENLAETGNNRETQQIDDHNIHRVMSDGRSDTDDRRGRGGRRQKNMDFNGGDGMMMSMGDTKIVIQMAATKMAASVAAIISAFALM